MILKKEIKVGMYLRHSGLDGDYPIIQKITELRTPGRAGAKYKVFTDKCGDWFIDSDYIELDKSKYSFNIMDLVKVGDYANGVKIVDIKHWNTNCEGIEYKIYLQNGEQIYERDIKEITTKEAFKAGSYKL